MFGMFTNCTFFNALQTDNDKTELCYAITRLLKVSHWCPLFKFALILLLVPFK